MPTAEFDICETTQADVEEATAKGPYQLWFCEGDKFYRVFFGEFGTLPPEFDYLYLRAEANGPAELHLPDGGEEDEKWFLETDVPGERAQYERHINYGPWKRVGTLPSPLTSCQKRRAALSKEIA